MGSKLEDEGRIEMAGHEQWKIGRTQSVTYGPGPAGKGYGFSIQDQHGRPLLSIAFDTKEDAEEAEAAVRVALAKAVHIEHSHSLALSTRKK
jgi:hypothetical protein